jgi:hypothetical protein
MGTDQFDVAGHLRRVLSALTTEHIRYDTTNLRILATQIGAPDQRISAAHAGWSLR